MARRLTTLAASPIRDFASRHKLKITIDRGDGSPIVLGRHGQLYEYGERIAFMLINENGSTCTPTQWGHARRAGVNAGMDLLLSGDAEGAFALEGEDRAQAKLAIKLVGCKAKRVLSPEQRERVTENLRKYRTGENGEFGALIASRKSTVAGTISA